MNSEKDKTEPIAITAFISSIIGLFFYGIVFGLVAVILGAISKEHGLGKAGLIIGIIDFVVVFIFMISAY
jgi:hypothetical protein